MTDRRMKRMPISGATRHDLTVTSSEDSDVGAHVPVMSTTNSRRFLAVKELGDDVDYKQMYGVAVTTFMSGLRGKNAGNPGSVRASHAQTPNPQLVIAVSGPVSVLVPKDTDTSGAGAEPQTITEKCREELGTRGLVLQSTRNTSNGIDIILYDSIDYFKELAFDKYPDDVAGY